MNPKVYIILLNYKNWQDTLECLVSLNRQSYANFEAVIVDNDSGNNSLQQIQTSLRDQNILYSIHYIQSQENGGFSKGNNEGLRFALSQSDGDYFWILNNDTTLDTQALECLVIKAQSDWKNGLKTGLYGSKLRYHARPEIIQAVGGRYNKWLGMLKEVGNLATDKGQFDQLVEPNVLVGASLFASKDFIEDVGLLGEDYFLYFEELDWAERAKRKGWRMMVVPESIVFHKQGMATQANGLQNNQKSKLSDFYYFRNRLRVTAQYFPFCLPTVYLSFMFTAMNRIRRGQWNRLGMLWNVLWRFKTIEFSDV